MSLSASIPLRREPEAGVSTSGQEFAWVGLAVLLALLASTMWIRRQRRSGSGWKAMLQRRLNKSLTVVESTRLSPTHSLHEVHWKGRQLLIGCSSQSTQLLAEMPLRGPEFNVPQAAAVSDREAA